MLRVMTRLRDGVYANGLTNPHVNFPKISGRLFTRCSLAAFDETLNLAAAFQLLASPFSALLDSFIFEIKLQRDD